ncbi:probable peroxisomal acyl-coenzyme A oxidase 1 [Colias croceus]|uniref:probable peroxisomal acyl-coenzyme A oxidase 1 n=1 Tax=Colias crocea TaxID=72248 RepID=UPI001E2818FE|nr:probable peroxisomal acyl-coenzyme A oxidase 1 [Colias croceus]
MSKITINEDLARERSTCDFDIEELTNILDGGKDRTMLRRDTENSVLDNDDYKDKVPEECLSIKERYENAVRKSCLYADLVKNKLLEMTALESFGTQYLRRTSDAYFKEVSPFLLHMGMFVPTIMGQCTPEQQATWLPKALNLEIIGTYAQTELGHGTFIRGLETTATYDPKTEEFVLHTPTLTAFKWWAGGLGKTANHCIVVAQLYTQGKCYGIHTFIVQVRDLETHEPLPGIKVGEIGPRMGFNTADNGFLGFDHFRIPRQNMLMKNAQVQPDGTYVKVARHEKLTYGTMVFVRVTLVSESAFNLAKAATIAVRYSAVRRQSEIRPGAPESQVLDYPTQQHKLFIAIATAQALQFNASWLWKTFTKVLSEMKKGNVDTLPELHALSSCLKAISTSDAAEYIAQCGAACGGHGYTLSSRLPHIYSSVVATRTYEGDYTVLLLQTARFLVKAWEQAEGGVTVTPTISYLNRVLNEKTSPWKNSQEGIIRAFEAISAGKIAHCVNNIRERRKTGSCYEDAWILTTNQLVAAAEAHCRAVLLRVYYEESLRMTRDSSENVRKVVSQLVQLYLTYWALERTGDLLRYTNISEKDLRNLEMHYEGLLAAIRPNAVGLVDAFDIRDEILQSTLGSYDGRVYDRLMEEALKTPLNADSVNQSFHKYLRRYTIQGKL